MARKMPLLYANGRDGSPAGEVALALKQYRDFVRRALLNQGVRSADVDDAVQQVFIVTYRRFDDYCKVSKKRSWMFAVSRLVARNYHRGVRRERAFALRYVPEPSPGLEEILLRREAAREVLRLLKQVEKRERPVLIRADMQGMTAAEIAVELQLNLNTVYSRLHRARQQFASALRVRWLREHFSQRPRKCL